MPIDKLTSDLKYIPDELKQCNQWLLWRLVQKPGKTKPDKIPVDVDGLATDATTANLSFNEVCEALALHPDRYSGLGFSFRAEDPFVGLDYDHILDDNGEITDPEIREEIRRLNSYTEISPSGKGLHVVVGGHRQPGMSAGKRRGCRELYHSAHYLTVTGNLFQDSPNTIRAIEADLLAEIYLKIDPPKPAPPRRQFRPVTLQVISDEEIIEALCRDPGRAALWSGDTAGYDSQSEADLSLANHLAYWCDRDPATVDRIFRASGLFREKWNREDYRNRTIEKAINGTFNTFSEDKARAEADLNAVSDFIAKLKARGHTHG